MKPHGEFRVISIAGIYGGVQILATIHPSSQGFPIPPVQSHWVPGVRGSLAGKAVKMISSYPTVQDHYPLLPLIIFFQQIQVPMIISLILTRILVPTLLKLVHLVSLKV